MTFPFDLNTTIGALLLGIFISILLYGVMCLQSWHYFRNYSDSPLIKSAVSLVLIAESLNSACSIHAIYFYLVLNFANPAALLKLIWSIVAVTYITQVIKINVGMFYIWRVYVVSKQNKPLVIAMIILQVACIGGGLAVSTLSHQVQFFSEVVTLRKVIVTIDVSLGLAATLDILIAGSLSFYLYTRKTGISKTDTKVDRLIIHAINNGIVTSIASVLSLTFATTNKTSLTYLAIYNRIGHLYSNTMLSTLNSWQHSSPSHVSAGHSDLYIHDFAITSPSSIPMTSMKNKKEDLEIGMEVNVHTIVN